MPLSTLDPLPALIVVDLQKGTVAHPMAHPIDAVVANAARLAGAFRSRGLPVVLVRVTGTAPGRTESSRPGGAPAPDWADLLEDLDPSDGDLLITKDRWGAFHDTPLDAHLRELGVTQVLICGVATSIGVEGTARAAFEHGYHVALLTDAMTDVDPAAHEHSLKRVFPRLGETATTEEVIALVEGR